MLYWAFSKQCKVRNENWNFSEKQGNSEKQAKIGYFRLYLRNFTKNATFLRVLSGNCEKWHFSAEIQAKNGHILKSCQILPKTFFAFWANCLKFQSSAGLDFALFLPILPFSNFKKCQKTSLKTDKKRTKRPFQNRLANFALFLKCPTM